MDKLLELDGNILLWIQDNLRNCILTPVMVFLSRIADYGMLWIFIGIILLCIRDTRKAGVTVALSMVTNLLALNLVLKNLVDRIRPYEVIDGLTRLVPAEKSFSFPSGHAGHAFAAAVVIYVMLPKKYGIPALILAVLIAFSRLYVGVHYPTDVLAGSLVGTVIALLAVAVVRAICGGAQKKEKQTKQQEHNRQEE